MTQRIKIVLKINSLSSISSEMNGVGNIEIKIIKFVSSVALRSKVIMIDCIFCKIISGIIPTEKIHETDDIIVVEDIAPKASVHYLIIPKKHVANIQTCDLSDQKMLGNILLAAQHLSTTLVDTSEFKLVSNNGKSVGQSVFHVHFHFLAGGGNYLETAVI